MDKNKNMMIRRSKRIHLNNKAASTLKKTRTKQWYQTVHQMGGIYKNQQPNINSIIYPEIATKSIPSELKNNITTHLTKSKQETVKIIMRRWPQYTPQNPGYDHTLFTSRQNVRR